MLNGLPEVNRLLTFNLALTFLEVSGGYVKEHAEAFSAFGWVSKRGWVVLGSFRAVCLKAPSRTQRPFWGWGKGRLCPGKLGDQDAWFVQGFGC